jgi:hypothetical protein
VAIETVTKKVSERHAKRTSDVTTVVETRDVLPVGVSLDRRAEFPDVDMLPLRDQASLVRVRRLLTKEEQMNRRAKIVDIPTQFLADILRPGTVIRVPQSNGTVWQTTLMTGVPDGTQSAGVFADFYHNCVSVCIEHESFAEVTPGCEMPRVVAERLYETIQGEPVRPYLGSQGGVSND